MSHKRAVFLPLEGAELENALGAIVRADLQPADFTLEERASYSFGRGGNGVQKLISVKRLTTGTQRQYSTGRGGGWPFEFERDLRCGFYGPLPSQRGTASAGGAR